MMRGARLIPVLGAVFLLLIAAHHLSRACLGRRLPLEDRAELTYFPHGGWVRPLTLGRARLAADLAWLQSIQYYGRHRMTDQKYPYAASLFETMTGLDPGFEEAYVFGALVLADRAASPEAAGRLLRRGMAANPESWRLPFEYGFLEFLREKDSKEAAFFLAHAGRMPGAPRTVARLAAYAAGKTGQRDLAMELWRELLRSSENPEVKRIARRYLRDLGAPEADSFPPER
jgi:tetratricopeptide (TPR) repeat protein